MRPGDASIALYVFFFFPFILRQALFYSFRVLIIVYRGHARMQHIALGRDTKGERRDVHYLPLGLFDALFRDDRHWRVNHCNIQRVVRVCSNLTKCVTAVYNSDEMRFYNVFFFAF